VRENAILNGLIELKTNVILNESIEIKKDINVGGALTSDTITTTGNATIGGTLNVSGSLSNPNQPCFKAVSAVSISVPSGNSLKYNNPIVDIDGGYSTTTGEYTIQTAGNWYSYYSFQSSGVAFKIQLQQMERLETKFSLTQNQP